ncbi:MAG: T9SS type A sorting domain-containing protein [Bacteroidales bacterium]|nr:T9SS type A sorting domain-containing protein [Bacteroidales bacterium]
MVVITCRTSKHHEDTRFLINDYLVPSVLNFTFINEHTGNRFSALNVFPNLASDAINITLDNPGGADVSLCITDLCGRMVASVLENKLLLQDDYHYIWHTELLPGCYIVKARVGAQEMVQKVVVAAGL